MIQTEKVKFINNNINPEIHKTPEAQQLKQSCQQFEAILWSKLLKDMKKSAHEISGSDKNRAWQQMEDVSQEMATDDIITKSGGAGLWKVLYNSLATKLAADYEAKQIAQANKSAMEL